MLDDHLIGLDVSLWLGYLHMTGQSGFIFNLPGHYLAVQIAEVWTYLIPSSELHAFTFYQLQA